MSGKNQHLPPFIRANLPAVRIGGIVAILFEVFMVVVTCRMVWEYPALVVAGYVLAALSSAALLYCMLQKPELRFEETPERSRQDRIPVMNGARDTVLAWYYPIVNIIMIVMGPGVMVSLILMVAGVGGLGLPKNF